MPGPRWGATAPSTASPTSSTTAPPSSPTARCACSSSTTPCPTAPPRSRGGFRSSRPAPRRCCWRPGWPRPTAGPLSTRHFAGLLRRDAALLTAATGAIAARRLDVPLDGGARVRELGESLAAMEQLRQALARSLSEQWAMEQERTQALAALAHDLKTPLSIVSGSAELLEEDALSPAQRERVDAILRSAGRIRDYMEQLRALTAAGGPAEAGGRATAELSALAEGWAAAGRGLCAPRGLRFSLDCPASRPCTLFRSELDRAVLNLLDNAAKFAAKGTTITVQITKKDGKAYTSIRNLGATIPPDELSLLFDRFHKADYSRSMDREGVGLGLYIVKTILGNLKENITVTSEGQLFLGQPQCQAPLPQDLVKFHVPSPFSLVCPLYQRRPFLRNRRVFTFPSKKLTAVHIFSVFKKIVL